MRGGRRPPWTISLRGTGAEQVVRTGRAAAVVRHDLSNPGLRGIGGAPPGAQKHFAASAPIELDGAIWGVLSILSGRPERTTPGVVERLGRFAELVSLAIASSASRRRLVDAAELDPLTGLANRRRFMARLEQDAAAALADGSTLALALIDLDRFKALNDTHGHPVGDEALVAIGRALAAGARRGDLVARIGGEEFACILPGADLEPARGAAERLIARIGAIDLGVDWSLSASAGVAALWRGRGLARGARGRRALRGEGRGPRPRARRLTRPATRSGARARPSSRNIAASAAATSASASMPAAERAMPMSSRGPASRYPSRMRSSPSAAPIAPSSPPAPSSCATTRNSTPSAADEHAGAGEGEEARADVAEQGVAGGVAMLVVHELEAVEVDVRDLHPRARAEHRLEAGEDRVAVECGP